MDTAAGESQRCHSTTNQTSPTAVTAGQRPILGATSSGPSSTNAGISSGLDGANDRHGVGLAVPQRYRLGVQGVADIEQGRSQVGLSRGLDDQPGVLQDIGARGLDGEVPSNQLERLHA